MKFKDTTMILILLTIVTAIFTVTPVIPEEPQRGPNIDKLVLPVIRGPDYQLLAMLVWTDHVLTDLVRPCDIECLDNYGFTITHALGFQLVHIGYNIRPNQGYRESDRPDWGSFGTWPLADVNFRHALFHCYDQVRIVATLHRYIVTPVQSLVPPAQGGWVNPAVPTHPYNPGNPFTSLPGEDSSCGILKGAEYTFVDADVSGTVTSADYWEKPDGYAIPTLRMYTPTYETAPTSADHGAMFVADLAEIGLAATGENGYKGLLHEPAEFADYMDKVDSGLFDIYMGFLRLDRFPDHLYDMCHSSQICGPELERKGRHNKPGICDPALDGMLETVKESLDHSVKLQAAWDAQERMNDPDASDQALAYMPLYSKMPFDAFNPDLRGIVKSPGYGSNIKWTHLNMYWQPGTERYDVEGNTFIHWILGDSPERLNPCYASTVYAWDIIDKTLDNLIAVNPYTHEDLPWLAESWNVVDTPSGPYAMNITFYIREDVFWQDGLPYTAHDAKFNWLFLRDNCIPRHTTTWKYIKDVTVINDHTVRVSLNVTSQFLLYDLASTAAMLPPAVWSRFNGKPLIDILGYDPSANTTRPAGAGPWFGTPQGPSTQLYGTGVFMFDYYDDVCDVGQLRANREYFKATDEIHAQLVEMFHRVGDTNYDGIVDSVDIDQIQLRLGSMIGDPLYDPDVDINSDGFIDMEDLSLANYFYGELREYPGPHAPEPVASFTFSPLTPVVGEHVTFDASGSFDRDGYIVGWNWDFGDGNSDTGKIVTHAYSAAETYAVTLTVTDNDALTDTVTSYVTVNPREDYEFDKTLSASEGELGDTIHVTLELNVPSGTTAAVEDTLPPEFNYVNGTFAVNGVSATPAITKNTPPLPIVTKISYNITESGIYVVEFDCKVGSAYWEDREVCNIAVATWYDDEGNVIETKEDVECFIIHAFEELHKNVGIPKADVVFAIDLTGSMGDEIAEVKANATNIMDSLAAQIADVQFGLISYMDYDGYYTTYSTSTGTWYNNTYGSAASGDYPYKLDQDITNNIAVMAAKINGLTLGWGADGPQDYTRIIHESWNDPNLHWRTDAKRILILFGDDVPHDTNFDNNNDATADNTGGDPGRDTILGTADDLDFETEVANAAANGVHIMAVYSGWTGQKFPWTYMANETSGGYFELTEAEQIPDAIKDLIKSQAEETLTIKERTEVQWAVVMDIINPFCYTMKNVTIKDNFGAELEIDQVTASPDTNVDGVVDVFDLAKVASNYGTIALVHQDQWDPVADINNDGVVDARDLGVVTLNWGVTLWLTGKTDKVHLFWYIGDLAPGETARIIILVSTDLNPAGHQEYTAPGVYEMNSGATLKFIDPEQDMQLSAVTDSIYVTVLPLEDP